jgi:hypothetical protein
VYAVYYTYRDLFSMRGLITCLLKLIPNKKENKNYTKERSTKLLQVKRVTPAAKSFSNRKNTNVNKPCVCVFLCGERHGGLVHPIECSKKRDESFCVFVGSIITQCLGFPFLFLFVVAKLIIK